MHVIDTVTHQYKQMNTDKSIQHQYIGLISNKFRFIVFEPIERGHYLAKSLNHCEVQRLALDLLDKHIFCISLYAFFHFGLDGKKEVILR